MVKSLAYASQLAGMRKVLKHCLHMFVASELIIAALCTVHTRLNTSPKQNQVADTESSTVADMCMCCISVCAEYTYTMIWPYALTSRQVS